MRCPRCDRPVAHAGETLVCGWCAHSWVPLTSWETILRRWVTARGWGRGNDLDDLVQVGLIAVWEHEPDTVRRGLTIAARDMIDWLRTTYGDRRMSGVCTRCRRPRRPADDEAACECPRMAYPPARRVSGPAGQVRRWHSLDEPVGDHVRDPPAGDDTAAEACALALADELWVGIGSLPARERDAVMADVNGEYLREVGARWGVTEARACQWRTAARRKLRAVA